MLQNCYKRNKNKYRIRAGAYWIFGLDESENEWKWKTTHRWGQVKQEMETLAFESETNSDLLIIYSCFSPTPFFSSFSQGSFFPKSQCKFLYISFRISYGNIFYITFQVLKQYSLIGAITNKNYYFFLLFFKQFRKH